MVDDNAHILNLKRFVHVNISIILHEHDMPQYSHYLPYSGL